MIEDTLYPIKQCLNSTGCLKSCAQKQACLLVCHNMSSPTVRLLYRPSVGHLFCRPTNTYQIQFRPTKAHGNADGLSRLPLKNSMGSDSVPISTIFNIHQLAALPVTSKQIAEATRRHPILSRVLHYTKVGWPAVLTEQTMQPYWSRRNELSVEQGCLLWGIRVIVPVKFQGAHGTAPEPH